MIPLLLAASALAAEDEPPLSAALHGDVKTFGVAVFPYDHLLMGTTWEPRCADLSTLIPPTFGTAPIPDDLCVPDPTRTRRIPATPSGQGLWNARLKLEARYADLVRLEVHHVAHATLGDTGGGRVQGFGTGVGIVGPQAVDLSWDAPIDGDRVSLIGYTDRLNVRISEPGIDLTAGRQAISFGTGLFFTPLDLVNPFTPTTIDTEYKPGVDALRVDGYFGASGRLTAVGAYAGGWALEQMVFATYGQVTVGVTDLGGFAGLVHGEPVVGLSTAGSVGALGVHGDAALTLPDDEDPFVRAVAGADWRPTDTTTLSGEAYVQTFGTTDPDAYLWVATRDRFARGEVWNWGIAYLGLAWTEQITPLVHGNLAVIANLTDPSAMVAPGLSWSVADNATLGVGGFAGIGARPDQGVRPEDLVDPVTFEPLGPRATARALGLNSEFGTYPAAVFADVKTYF